MTTEQATNQMYQRAHFAAVLCTILSDWPSDVTHEEIKIFVCKSLSCMTEIQVDDSIERKLLSMANQFIDQHNTLIEARQIINN